MSRLPERAAPLFLTICAVLVQQKGLLVCFARCAGYPGCFLYLFGLFADVRGDPARSVDADCFDGYCGDGCYGDDGFAVFFPAQGLQSL